MKRFRSKKSSVSPSPFNYIFNIRNYVNYTRFLILATTCLFTLGGAYYAFFFTPQYTATVYLSSQIYGSLSAVAMSKENAIPLDDKETSAPRQLELIQSPIILTKLINVLMLDIEVSGEKASEFKISELLVPAVLNNETISVESLGNGHYLLQVPKVDLNVEGVQGQTEYFYVGKNERIQIQIDALPAQAGTKADIVKKPVGQTMDDIIAHTLFEAPGVDDKLVTNLIRVSYTGLDPELVTHVVNKLADIAVQESKFEESREAFQAFELMKVEKEQVLSFLNETGRQLADVNKNLNRLSLNEEIDSKFTADKLIEIEKNLVKAKAEVSMLQEKATENNPKVKQALASYDSLIAERTAVEGQAHQSLQKGDKILDLQRDLLVYTNLYQEICKNLQQFEARVVSPVGNLSVLEYAKVPDTPVSYSRPIIILLSAMIGLICGYIVALVLD